MRSFNLKWASFILLICLIQSCKGPDNNKERLLPHSPIKETVIDGLAFPWSMAFIDESEVLLTEKEGDLLRINLKSGDRTVVKGKPEDLFEPITIDAYAYPQFTYPTSLQGQTTWGNCGLLDIALDPNYDDNRLIYMSYVAQRNDSFALKVIRAELINDSLHNPITLLNPGPYVPGLWHFGGGLCIYEDHLYVTVGERLFFEKLKQGLPVAQDVKDERGAIYRIGLDGSVPVDNPSLGEGAIPGMYAFGIRAAQGICVRPNQGEIWFSEHGTIHGDEINLLEAGANYGWPNQTSGRYRTPDYVPDSLPAPIYTDPRHFWLQTVAPTGLMFYTGEEFPLWKDNLMVSGLSRGSIWRLVLDGQTVVSAEELFLDDHVRSRNIVQSPNGKLYMLTDEANGKIVRIRNGNGLETH